MSETEMRVGRVLIGAAPPRATPARYVREERAEEPIMGLLTCAAVLIWTTYNRYKLAYVGRLREALSVRIERT